MTTQADHTQTVRTRRGELGTTTLTTALATAIGAAGCLALGIAMLTGNTGQPEQADNPRAAQADTLPVLDKPAAGEKLSFNRDIRPILSDKCFACHGPDANIAKDAGGFRLDIREGAVAPAQASGKIPIIPGDADNSEVIKRLLSDKPNIMMPPPTAKMKVSDEEIALLKRWINEGAEYQGHWAYQTPTKPALPEVKHQGWTRNPIDYFIAARAEKFGMTPSPEADRETLIRRLSLDLVGLPPTPREIDAFVNDQSPDAYDNLVDRLLASPHFGERLAIVWMDAARYADTNGFHRDNYRTAWPWRQWVIEAFNQNMPYDQFVTWQLAGDMLPGATQEQVLASGFCRMHNINDEGGALDEEYIVEAIADRIETIATVFMAQTYTCARCHDHKYDPTTQEDYFATWAYFNSVAEEEGVYRNNFEQARAYPPRMMWKSDETLARIDEVTADLEDARAERNKLQAVIDGEMAEWHESFRATAGINWANAKLVTAVSSDPKTKVTIKPDGSALLSGKEAPAREDITLTLRTDQTGLRLLRLDCLTDRSFTKNGLGRANNGNAVLTHLTVQAVSVADPNKTQEVEFAWAWADKAQSNNDHDILNVLRDDNTGWALGGHTDDHARLAMFVSDKPFGFEGGTELRVKLHHQSPYDQHTLGRVRVDFAAGNDTLLQRFPLTSGDWFQVGPFNSDLGKAVKTRFGPEDATSFSTDAKPIRGKTWAHAPDYTDGKAHSLKGANRVFYFGRSIFTPVARKLDLYLGSDDALQVYLNGKEVYSYTSGRRLEPDTDKVTITLPAGENALVLKNSNGGGPGGFYYRAEQPEDKTTALQPLALLPDNTRPKHLDKSYYEGWVAVHSPTAVPVNNKVAELEAQLKSLEAQAVPVLIMKEADKPTPSYILERGAYDKPQTDRVIQRRPPSMIDLPMPEGAPNNRLGFAQWLTQPEHPLTGRVHVNRLWNMIFGTGIVKTVEDFGSQADWPSHPALLDYLAVDFVESGWDQKALIKKIVMSATYRQQATRKPAAAEADPNNRLMSYFPRRRLVAELIRDNALHIAGLLDTTIGGPSVKPYQPPGLWNEVAIGGSNTGRFKRGGVDELYRRSLYTFWKKTSPPPQMSVFNAPTREFCVVSRDTTNTPLQVLTLWNDEQFLEAARVLGQRTLAEAQTDDKRLSLIFKRCTGSDPDANELDVLRKALSYYRERYKDAPEDAKALLDQGEYPLPEEHDPAELASWMMVASSVLSLDETIVRD